MEAMQLFRAVQIIPVKFELPDVGIFMHALSHLMDGLDMVFVNIHLLLQHRSQQLQEMPIPHT